MSKLPKLRVFLSCFRFPIAKACVTMYVMHPCHLTFLCLQWCLVTSFFASFAGLFVEVRWRHRMDPLHIPFSFQLFEWPSGHNSEIPVELCFKCLTGFWVGRGQCMHAWVETVCRLSANGDVWCFSKFLSTPVRGQ